MNKSLIDVAHGLMSMYAWKRNVQVLFSGGKDSVVTAHLAAQNPYFQGVIHVHTNTGPKSVEQSRKTVEIAKSFGWKVIEAAPFTTYEMLVVEHGFPGPPSHRYMYQYLKERPLRQARKKAKIVSKYPLLFVAGIRRAESQRRANAPEFNRVGGVDWLSPLINWKQADVLEYIERHNLPYNADQDCLCGAFAHPNEREETIEHHSGQAAYWANLEKVVHLSRERQLMEVDLGTRKASKVIKEHQCRWGHGIGTSIDIPTDGAYSLCNDCQGQLDIDGNVGIDPDKMLISSRA